MSALFIALCATAQASPSVILDLEWRGISAADHLSHGPGFGIAVGLLDNHLQLGLHGFSRPGPWNPATFTLTPEEPYNGKDTLQLRSDGGLLGPGAQVGADLSERLRVDLGATVGYGGFGFYLVGEDRETPDGERTSVWENQLMDGRDSSLGIGMDVGPQLTWAVSEHVRPYVAARYQTIFGYDAFMVSDYSGVSVAIGLSTGRF